MKGALLAVVVAATLFVLACGAAATPTPSPTATPTPSPTALPPFQLTILHTSENHGHWESIAITNGGGIRASIKAGDISYGQVLEALPFGNRLVQFDLTGADVLAALENGHSGIEADPGASKGRFLQVGGLKFSANLGRPAGSRVTDVLVGMAESSYKPLDKTAVYRIVTTDFLFNGGDSYDMFKKAQNVRGGDVPQDLVVSDYINAHSPINAKVEGRITLTKP